jgi:hypothetical protein
LLESKPTAFHKQKHNFSTFIDVSKGERELSKLKLSQIPDELPSICSRNLKNQFVLGKVNNTEESYDINDSNAELLREDQNEYIEKRSKTRIQTNRSKSPIEKYLTKHRKHSLNENSFMKKRLINIIQQKEEARNYFSIQDIKMNNTQNEVQKQLANETLYKKKNKINKITVEKNLFNNDSRCITSLKGLLQKAKTSVKLSRPGQGDYSSDQHNIDRLRKQNYSVQLSRQSSIDVREGPKYVMDSIQDFEKKKSNTENGANVFKKPPKFIKKFQE